MLKLSKCHKNIKVAQEQPQEEPAEQSLLGSDVLEEDAPELMEADGGSSEPVVGEEDSVEESTPSKKYLATHEAATPHIMKAKELFKQVCMKEQELAELKEQLSKDVQVINALVPKGNHESLADDPEFRKYIKPKKEDPDAKKKAKKKKNASIVDGLLKIAIVLDYAGDREGVSLVEDVLHIFANKEDKDSKYDLDTIEKIERKYVDVDPIAPTLSTRGCPDHNGAQMQRIAEGSFQCELDGKVYNWNEGFKDYSGNTYSGARISSVDFPDTAERIFETRSMALSKNQK